jgi:uncharacterized membrane protein
MLTPQTLLLAVYLLAEHFSVVLGLPRLAVVTLALLAAMVLMAPLRAGRAWAWALLLALCGALSLPGASRWAPIALMLPPTVVNAALAWLFAHTLLGGRMPLVERMVRLLHEPEPVDDPEVLAYARSVTRAWAALLAGNALLSLLLALMAVPVGLLSAAGIDPPWPVPVRWWSAFANLGCYALVALMFVIEYAVRRRRFPWQPYRNLFDFLGRAARIGPRLAAQLAGERAARRGTAR